MVDEDSRSEVPMEEPRRPARRGRDDNDDDDDDRGGRRGGMRGGPRGRFGRGRSRAVYSDAYNRILQHDYKDVDALKLFVTERGKIRPRRQTGVSAKQQRRMAGAVKRARHMALLPYIGGSDDRD